MRQILNLGYNIVLVKDDYVAVSEMKSSAVPNFRIRLNDFHLYFRLLHQRSLQEL